MDVSYQEERDQISVWKVLNLTGHRAPVGMYKNHDPKSWPYLDMLGIAKMTWQKPHKPKLLPKTIKIWITTFYILWRIVTLSYIALPDIRRGVPLSFIAQ